jgi:hypothetical protein
MSLSHCCHKWHLYSYENIKKGEKTFFERKKKSHIMSFIKKKKHEQIFRGDCHIEGQLEKM